jgi:hypothetical protein
MQQWDRERPRRVQLIDPDKYGNDTFRNSSLSINARVAVPQALRLQGITSVSIPFTSFPILSNLLLSGVHNETYILFLFGQRQRFLRILQDPRPVGKRVIFAFRFHFSSHCVNEIAFSGIS